MTRVYLIRHGETRGNAEQRFQGRTDTDLSEVGERQAALLGERFRDIPLDAVYSSPLTRALKTAQGLCTYQRVEIVPCLDVIEMSLGVWEGLTWSEVEARSPGFSKMWQHAFHECAIEGGESSREVLARMKGAMARIVEQNRGKTVAVVSHGGAIRAYLSHALGLPFERIGEIVRVQNTSVSCIEYEDDGLIRVVCLGDTSHLD